MRIRTIIGTGVVALGATAAASIPLTASAQVTPAAGATASSSSSAAVRVHTLTFTAVTTNQTEFSASAAVLREVDVNAKGKTIGYDILYATFDSKTNTGTLSGAVVLNGGIMVLRASTTGNTLAGRIVGGTDAYAHVKGTFRAKPVSKTRETVTIAYTGR